MRQRNGELDRGRIADGKQIPSRTCPPLEQAMERRLGREYSAGARGDREGYQSRRKRTLREAPPACPPEWPNTKASQCKAGKMPRTLFHGGNRVRRRRLMFAGLA